MAQDTRTQDKKEEREKEKGGRIEDLSFGDTVIAKLTSGSKEGNTASITIEDTNPPTAPTFGETSEEKGKGGWYKDDTVTVRVNPGTDEESGILKTTYKIEGAETKEETEGTSITLTREGINTVTAYTYDNTGNRAESEPLEIKIDRTDPFCSCTQFVFKSIL